MVPLLNRGGMMKGFVQGVDRQQTTLNAACSAQLRRASAPQIRPLTAAEFLQLELPPRQKILAPWVPEKGLVMVYSPRRMGKTLFGMSSAYVIGIGGS
jgi:hypothetical protein